jgi:hypothetical protein
MVPRTPLRKIHWRVPAIIILAFVAGLAFALGHHAFYSSLDGQPVNAWLFNQQINLAVGQAFAFLVRASLVISVGTSYWQVFWGTMLHGTLAVSQVDALAGMLGSILDLLNLKASTTRPVLIALALLSWMVPLASILPPATLSVHSTTRPEITDRRVPIPRFDDLSMALLTIFREEPDRTSDEADDLWNTVYRKPARPLSRLVTATAYRGTIPDHHTAFPDSTYTLTFPAPALRCEVIPEDLLMQFNDAMNCSFVLDESDDDDPKASCEIFFTYLSWVPRGDILVPFEPNSMTNGTMSLEPDHQELGNLTYYFNDPHYIGGAVGAPASVYLAKRSQRLPYDVNNWDLLNCSIYNASYSVSVTSDSNGRGVLSKPKLSLLNSVPFDAYGSKRTIDTHLPASESANFGYLALMESFNRIVVGTIFGNKHSRIEDTSYYQEDTLTVQNEGFKQTLLPYTADLLPFLSLGYHSSPTWDTVHNPPDAKQWRTVKTFSEDLTVLFPNEAFSSSTFNRSLASVLEELFHNMTLSLFSNEAFLELSAKNIMVEYTITENTYAYDSRNLLISYGLAVSFALLAGIAGCLSIYSNGASYSNRFSTVLRTTRGQELEELVLHNDRTGVDPLPKHLEKARIDLRRGQVESERDIDGWRPENISEQTSMIGILRSDGQAGASS